MQSEVPARFPERNIFAKVLNYAHPQTTSTFCQCISKRKSRIGKIAYRSIPNQLFFGYTVLYYLRTYIQECGTEFV